MRFWKILLVLPIAGVAGFLIATSPKPIPPTDSAQILTFDTRLISRGESLAAMGNCDTCHTAKGGARFAGGRGIPTPFGTIYSTNITPDRDTGLGSWPENAFQRAMRAGISRDGHYLYPAFPYDHFTKVTQEDNQALYAYLISQPPVSAAARDNSVGFPLNIRRLVAVWNGLFLKKGTSPADPTQTAEWNRGAYLVNGLGHCGACHTPRNFLGAERANRALAGGRAEGWDAYALDGASPAPIAWTVDSLATFLKTGWHAEHGNARGPMQPVTEDLARLAEPDVHAIATYLATSIAARPAGPSVESGQVSSGAGGRGADVFAASCASCHPGDAPLPFGGIDFQLSSAVNAPDPRNVILVTLAGLPATDGRAVGMMPGFDGAMSNDDLNALLVFLRQRFSNQPPWGNLTDRIETARRAMRESIP
jgi:mono/diheme cytochrome c family protein